MLSSTSAFRRLSGGFPKNWRTPCGTTFEISMSVSGRSTWRSFSERFPGIAEALLIVAAIDRQAKALPAWIAHDGLATLDVFIEAEIGLVIALRETRDNFVDDIHARRDRPEAQGEYLGHVVGRILVEVVMFVAPELVAARRLGAARKKSRVLWASRPRRRQPSGWSRRTRDTKHCCRGRRRSCSRDRARCDATGTCFGRGVLGCNTSQSPVRRAERADRGRSTIFGAPGRALRGTSGHSAQEDAHHIVERRFFKFIDQMRRERPEVAQRFLGDLKKLGWLTDDHMEAVALEMEFHINRGSTLVARMEEAGADLVVVLGEKYPELLARGGRLDPASAEGLRELRSLSKSLETEIPDFEKYQILQRSLTDTRPSTSGPTLSNARVRRSSSGRSGASSREHSRYGARNWARRTNPASLSLRPPYRSKPDSSSWCWRPSRVRVPSF